MLWGPAQVPGTSLTPLPQAPRPLKSMPLTPSSFSHSGLWLVTGGRLGEGVQELHVLAVQNRGFGAPVRWGRVETRPSSGGWSTQLVEGSGGAQEWTPR